MPIASLMKAVALSAAVVLFPLVSSGANAGLIFEFSFTNDPTDNNLDNTKVAGTVTGRILGLVDNDVGQSATSVFIDSFPSLDAGFGPLDVEGIDLAPSAFNNTFDVLGGEIIDAFFISNFLPNNGGTAQLRLNSQDLQEPGANVLRHMNVVGPDQLAVGNRDGLQGVTFAQPGGSVVPAPGTLALMVFGLAALRLRCKA